MKAAGVDNILAELEWWEIGELGKKQNFLIIMKMITGEILYNSKLKSKGASNKSIDYNAHL